MYRVTLVALGRGSSTASSTASASASELLLAPLPPLPCLGVLFFSPSKVTGARELQTAKETGKDEETLDRLLQAQDKVEKKAQKEAEVQQRRENRAIMHRARTAKEALKKAQEQQQKEGRDAQRQLEQYLRPWAVGLERGRRLRRSKKSLWLLWLNQSLK
jgi:flagellar biosynthesis component FlhA